MIKYNEKLFINEYHITFIEFICGKIGFSYFFFGRSSSLSRTSWLFLGKILLYKQTKISSFDKTLISSKILSSFRKSSNEQNGICFLIEIFFFISDTMLMKNFYDSWYEVRSLLFNEISFLFSFSRKFNSFWSLYASVLNYISGFTVTLVFKDLLPFI